MYSDYNCNTYFMKTAKCPIVIPSYKNRVGNIVQHLEQVSDNKIYVFVYADDYDNYKEYNCKQNVEFVKLNVSWRSIQKKRRYIQDYFAERPDIERYLMIDDDLRFGKINENGKTIKIDLKSALATLEELHIKYGVKTVSGPEGNNLAFAHATRIVKQNPFYQVFLFENKWVIEHPECRFRDMENVAEDLIIWYDCIKHNQPFYAFQTIWIDAYNMNSLASSSINLKKNQINALRIMKNECKISISNWWKSWCIGLSYNCPFFIDIKEILDKNLPEWWNLDNNYSDKAFEICYNEIDHIVKDKLTKPKSDLGKFLQ